MVTQCRILCLAFISAVAALDVAGWDAEALKFNDAASTGESMRHWDFSYDGFKDHWSRDAWRWNAARGLFLQSQQTAEGALWAMEEEIGNQLMLEELWVQQGFLDELMKGEFTQLERPSPEAMAAAPAGNLLLAVTDQDDVGRDLVSKLPEAWQFRRNRAFFLKGSAGTLFVLACHTADELTRLQSIVTYTVALVKENDFHRGLAGVSTNYLMITPGVGHNPFDLVAMARKLGCDWMMVSGYNDWMMPEPVRRALSEVGDPFVFVSGQTLAGGAMFGIDRYPDIQNNTLDQCLDWAEEKGGYYFASLSAAGDEHADRYKGYLIGGRDDQARLDELDVPFLAATGDIYREAPTTMLVLLPKSTPLTQQSLFDAILAKQAVAVYPEGVVVGPRTLRHAIQFLLLEGTGLSNRVGGDVQVEAAIDGGTLSVALRNAGTQAQIATLAFQTGQGLRFREGASTHSTAATLQPDEEMTISIPLEFTPAAGGHNNLVSVTVEAQSGADAAITPRALAWTKTPPTITFNTLRYDAPGTVTYPVSLWNGSDNGSVPMTFVVSRKDTGEEVHSTERVVAATPWRETRQEITFDVASGDYVIEASALGATTVGQLAVREAPGEVSVHEEDLDGDGAPEVIMENETVRVAVLMEGGRVIQYILKATGENIFFQLWPKTPPLHGTVGGNRPFYPYGGLEEFIGYPYIGGHIVYQYEILQPSGSRGRVRVWANIHGSRISKIYTLYAGGPVLEASYAFSEMTRSIDTLGINPLFELGPSTGPEDHYYFPEGEDLVETRPELERYYGRATFPREGWAAGQDPDAGVSLVIGYPVNDAVYLHLWNNHPDNTPTPYYYTEIQPWLQLHHGTTTYFSYYVLGGTTDWKVLLDTFRGAGLVAERINPEPWDY